MSGNKRRAEMSPYKAREPEKNRKTDKQAEQNSPSSSCQPTLYKPAQQSTDLRATSVMVL